VPDPSVEKARFIANVLFDLIHIITMESNVHDTAHINDIRNAGDFKTVSFSNYRKIEVKRVFIDNIHKMKLEAACYWCAELICAGHFMDVWEVLLYYLGKYIHLGNPRMVIYLESRFMVFRNIIEKGNFVTELQLRNHTNVRKLFSEIVCVVTLSPRKHSYDPIRIKREEEFNVAHMTEQLKAPSVEFAAPVFQEEDPKELYIAVNEFAYAVSKEGACLLKACYWVEWVIEFDIMCRKRKELCRCQRRSHVQVAPKYQKDVIWLIWDVLIHYSGLNTEFIKRIMQSLMNLFCIKYTTACCKRRRYLLYYAVGLLADTVPTSTEIISLEHKKMLASVVEQIHKVYQQIKKSEVSPNTDYLFSNMDQSNAVENTMRKLEIMEGALPNYHRDIGGGVDAGHDDDEFLRDF
jgi:hypothetical protein